jgi:hypothetical protein
MIVLRQDNINQRNGEKREASSGLSFLPWKKRQTAVVQNLISSTSLWYVTYKTYVCL